MLRTESTLKVTSKNIIMNEYDYGLDLPFYLSGDILKTDKIIFSIKKSIYQEVDIITKEYTGDDFKEEEKKLIFNLSFTKEESAKLPAGKYIYIIQQCRGCELHNTIVADGVFEVRKGRKPCTLK